MAKTVFYSFHYDQDVMRVQLVQKIGAITGEPVLNAQDWESTRQKSKATIQQWIDNQMKYKSAVVVLIGSKTASRPWVKYEIERAWSLKRPMLGIYIHGISRAGSTDSKGADPFDAAEGVSGITVFDPTVNDYAGRIDSKATYAKLAQNLESWAGQGRVRL